MKRRTFSKLYASGRRQARPLFLPISVMITFLMVGIFSVPTFASNDIQTQNKTDTISQSSENSTEGSTARNQSEADTGNQQATSDTVPSEIKATKKSKEPAIDLPIDLQLSERASHVTQVVVIALTTFFSEDLTCITVGLLIRAHEMNPFIGILGCFLGIFAGDLGLWMLGRFGGRRLIRWKHAHKFFPAERLDRWGAWFDRHGWTAIVASRCLPGTRIPTYVGAGMIGQSAGRFAIWAMLAGLVWTPVLIGLSALLGPIVIKPFETIFGAGWLPLFAALVVIFLIVRTIMMLLTAEGRSRLVARYSRLWHYEYWPSWLFYLPIVPYVLFMALKHRGLMTATAVNPGIPDGGVVGESKYQILNNLKGQEKWVIPSQFIPAGDDPEIRSSKLIEIMKEKGWSFPLILKPDVGERGAGLKLVKNMDDIHSYFENNKADVLVQTYHPGPYEAGIFYYRIPGEEQGHILSITDKEFPVIVGDGEHTLRQLIWLHLRYRMQAKTFFKRHREHLDHVLEKGEQMPLALAGNHCQGTLFRDGSHLVTEKLRQRIDSIMSSFPDFDMGRMDVRYTSVEAFKAGEDLAIMEVNGVTSELTNVYDPKFNLWQALSQIFKQVSILYSIGEARIKMGTCPSKPIDLLKRIYRHHHHREICPLSD